MPQMTAAPYPIKLPHAGVTYLMTPLTDRDIDTLTNALRGSYIAMARSSLTKGLSQEERDETLRVAMREARDLTWMEGDGKRYMSSVDGSIYVLYVSVLKLHPNLTHETFKADLLKEARVGKLDIKEVLEACLDIFIEVNNGPKKPTDERAPVGAEAAESDAEKKPEESEGESSAEQS